MEVYLIHAPICIHLHTYLSLLKRECYLLGWCRLCGCHRSRLHRHHRHTAHNIMKHIVQDNAIEFSHTQREAIGKTSHQNLCVVEAHRLSISQGHSNLLAIYYIHIHKHMISIFLHHSYLGRGLSCCHDSDRLGRLDSLHTPSNQFQSESNSTS
jgi:hypothetical protein